MNKDRRWWIKCNKFDYMPRPLSSIALIFNAILKRMFYIQIYFMLLSSSAIKYHLLSELIRRTL